MQCELCWFAIRRKYSRINSQVTNIKENPEIVKNFKEINNLHSLKTFQLNILCIPMCIPYYCGLT